VAGSHSAGWPYGGAILREVCQGTCLLQALLRSSGPTHKSCMGCLCRFRCSYGADLKHNIWGSGAFHLTWALRSLSLAHSKFEGHAAERGLTTRATHRLISQPEGEWLLSGLGKSRALQVLQMGSCAPMAPCALPVLSSASSTRFVFSILGPLVGLPEFALPTNVILFFLVHLNISVVICSSRNERRVFSLKTPKERLLTSVSSGTLPQSSKGKAGVGHTSRSGAEATAFLTSPEELPR